MKKSPTTSGKLSIRVVALVFVVAFSGAARAEGLYDGIWKLTDFLFASIHQNGDSIVAIELILLDSAFWGGSQGTLVGNEAVLTTVVSAGAKLSYRVTFTSSTTANVTILSCVPDPGSGCLSPAGTTLVATRIF